MSRRTPSTAVPVTVHDPSSQDAVAPLLSRRRVSLPTEPMNTPGRPTNYVTAAVRGGGLFARDIFIYSASDVEYRTSAPPASNSQQVFINDGIVLSSTQHESAPCYFNSEDASVLHLRGTFPAQDGDYVVIRYVTAPGAGG